MTADTVDVTEHLDFAARVGTNLAYRYGVTNFEDAQQDAVLGMVEASQRFDPDRGIPFLAFAARRMHGAVVDGIRTRAWWSQANADAKQPLQDIEALEALGEVPGTESFEDELIDRLDRERQREWVLGHADVLTEIQADYLGHLMQAPTHRDVARRFSVTESNVHYRATFLGKRLRAVRLSRCRSCESAYHSNLSA